MMKMMKSEVFILLICLSFLVTACGRGTASAPAAEHVPQSNKDEIVNAEFLNQNLQLATNQ